MTVTIRDYTAVDRDWAVALNNAAMPAVSELDNARIDMLASQSPWFRIAELDGSRAGMLLCCAPGATYDSMNYQWVSERFDAFLYVDRVIVDPDVRGGGVGLALYENMIQHGRSSGIPRITLEVNERPPNPGSMRFHERLGFGVVGGQDTDGGKKRVAYMSLEL